MVIGGYWWLLVTIGGYFINDYSVVSHWWLCMVMFLMVINGYCIIIYC